MGLFNWFRRKRSVSREVIVAGAGQRVAVQQKQEPQKFRGGQPLSDLYMLPKDLQEVNRLDFQHYMLRYALKSLYLAPIGQPAHILDVACGTGRWVLEMATAFPQAHVTGIDLTPPSTVGIAHAFPTNCAFQRVDVLEGLPFSPQSFDFVHQRLLVMALPLVHWPTVVYELARITALGGWVELVELDLMFNNRGRATELLLHWIAAASQQRGMDISIGLKIGSFLQYAGLANIEVKKVPIPLGNWGGRLGNMLITDFYAATRTLQPLVTAKNSISVEEYDRVVNAWMRECEEYHTTCDFYVAYGRKAV